MVNSFWPIFTNINLKVDRELIWKKNFVKLKNANVFLKTTTFKSHNRHKISINLDELLCRITESQLRQLLMRHIYKITK